VVEVDLRHNSKEWWEGRQAPGQEVEAARPSNTNDEEALDKFEYSNGKSSASVQKALFSLAWSIYLRGISCESRRKNWRVYLGKQASRFFPSRSHHSDWPVFRTIGTYDKLQIKLILIPSSLPASFQARTVSRALLFACRCNIPDGSE